MSDPTLIELKAAAYDCIAQVEAAQARLAEINRRIAELQSQANEPGLLDNID